MKTLDPVFQNAITQKVTTIAWCWLIERLDGVKLGFTSFDLPLPIDGVIPNPHLKTPFSLLLIKSFCPLSCLIFK